MQYQEMDDELTVLSICTPPGLFLTDEGDLLWLIPGIGGPTAIALNGINHRPLEYFELKLEGGAVGKWLVPLELRLGYEARGDFDGVSGLVRRKGTEFYLTAHDHLGHQEEFRLVEYERKFLGQFGGSKNAQTFSHWSLVKLDQNGGETVFTSAVEPIRHTTRYFPQSDPKPIEYKLD